SPNPPPRIEPMEVDQGVNVTSAAPSEESRTEPVGADEGSDEPVGTKDSGASGTAEQVERPVTPAVQRGAPGVSDQTGAGKIPEPTRKRRDESPICAQQTRKSSRVKKPSQTATESRETEQTYGGKRRRSEGENNAVDEAEPDRQRIRVRQAREQHKVEQL